MDIAWEEIRAEVEGVCLETESLEERKGAEEVFCSIYARTRAKLASAARAKVGAG